MRVGFWPDLYDPECEQAIQAATDPQWRINHPNEFVRVVTFLQKPDHSIPYRGSSVCRCCREMNGNETWYSGPLEYPEGYIHYIVSHNIKPPQAVINLILKLD